jgi:DNA modification methylase
MVKQFFLKVRDCLKGMRLLKDEQVDFAFFDPPYNVGKNYENYRDKIPKKKYLSWVKQIIVEADRVTRHGFAVYTPYIHFQDFVKMIPCKFDLITIRMQSRAIIEKKNYIRRSPFNLTQHCHYIIVTRPAVKLTKNLWDDCPVPDDGFMFKEKRFGEPRHPAPTSLKITKRIIDCFTLPKETVLDCFLGTGTTAVACLELKRRCVGFDLNQRYVNIAKKRVGLSNEVVLAETRNPLSVFV